MKVCPICIALALMALMIMMTFPLAIVRVAAFVFACIMVWNGTMNKQHLS